MSVIFGAVRNGLRDLLCRLGSGEVFVMWGPFGGSWVKLPGDELF